MAICESPSRCAESLPKAIRWSSLPLAREAAQMPNASKQGGQCEEDKRGQQDL